MNLEHCFICEEKASIFGGVAGPHIERCVICGEYVCVNCSTSYGPLTPICYPCYESGRPIIQKITELHKKIDQQFGKWKKLCKKVKRKKG